MKKINSLPFIIAILAGVSLLVVFLVMQPAWFNVFNLSSERASNIGSAIGGIIGPVVSMYSAYLLYEALTAQLTSIKEQRGKADSDIVFLLFNQLEKEYDSFSLRQTKGDKEIIKYGYEAISESCYIYSSQTDDIDMWDVFKESVDGSKILYLIRSFMLIREKIEDSDLEDRTKRIFNRKLQYYYRAKFKYPVLFLTRAFQHKDHPMMSEIRDFQRLNDLVL